MDNPVLVRYEHADGVGTLTHEFSDGREISRSRPEPTSPQHRGWNPAAVLAARPLAEMLRDAMWSHLHR